MLRFSPKAALKVLLVTLAVSEARAGGFGPADTAAIQASVHFRLMKAKHLQKEIHLTISIYK